MTSSRGRLFSGTALLEVALVVAGVFLAFALEAWRSDRAERLEVRAELENVLAEFVVNRDLVERYLGWHARAERAAGSLARTLRSGAAESVVVPDSLLWGTSFTPTFDARTGALDALLTSGRFGSVPNAELRGALAGFDGYLRDARDEEIRARNYTDEQVVSVLLRSGDVGRALSCVECRDEGFVDSRETRVANSTELQALLERRALFASLSIESLDAVRQQVETIIRLISEELERT